MCDFGSLRGSRVARQAAVESGGGGDGKGFAELNSNGITQRVAERDTDGNVAWMLGKDLFDEDDVLRIVSRGEQVDGVE